MLFPVAVFSARDDDFDLVAGYFQSLGRDFRALPDLPGSLQDTRVLPDWLLGVIIVPSYTGQVGVTAMPEKPTIAIPLDLPDVRLLRTELTSDQELIIEVESTLTTTTCRRCGQTISAFYRYDRPLMLRHLASFGYVVYIRVKPKRFRCPYCDDHPTTTQRLSWYAPKALHTMAYERHL